MSDTTAQKAAGTPAAQWRVDGEPDPHAGHYDGERAALTLGHLTDDELANGVYMNADRPMDIARVLAKDPDYHPPIVWLTAAKERIRWLSRALVRAQEAATTPEAQGPDFADGPDEDGFNGPRPWNGFRDASSATASLTSDGNAQEFVKLYRDGDVYRARKSDAAGIAELQAEGWQLATPSTNGDTKS
jgi:hypothetical protein